MYKFDTNKQLLMQQMDDHGQKISDLFQTGRFLSTCSNLTCDFGEMSAGQIYEVCAVGSTFYQVNGHLVCAKCGPGWIYAENSCIQCPEGFYQDRSGQQDCKKCPDERTSTIGAFSISQCLAGQESRELSSPFDTATVVGGAVGGLFVLVLLLIILVAMIQRRKPSLKSLKSANKSHYPNPVYEESEKKSSLDS
ncbi:uncharacterized protein LOC134238867 [Saccostrea cucullata]|uniref:uncharacterized protein LOC134238867 n=1 Tax=Saccostrea cuccullata TaxID=36930 RepID=UPI002ED3AC30